MSRMRVLAATFAATILLAGGGPGPIRATAPDGSGPLLPNGVGAFQDADGWHLVGTYWKEPTCCGRAIDVHVQIIWLAGTEIVGVVSEPILLDAVVNDSFTPWHIVVTDEFVGADSVTLSDFRLHDRDLFPVGGLDLSAATTDGHSVSGTVENDSPIDAQELVIHATLRNAEGAVVDTASSPAIPILAGGTSMPYAFVGNANAEPATTVEVWAETTAGPYLTNWENHFNDLDVARFDAEILWLARERIVSGCNGGNFCPRRGVTRAQMATFLDRALDLPDTHVDHFTDDDGHWAEDSINRMAEAGITDGCGETTFCPTGRVNRGQIAKFLVLGYALPSSSVDAFVDDGNSTTEAYHNALAAAGITNGCNAFQGKYCPNRQLIRDEMAAFLYRAEHFEP